MLSRVVATKSLCGSKVPRLRDGRDAADDVGKGGPSDQLWMGTIQEALTCGRFMRECQRKKTCSPPQDCFWIFSQSLSFFATSKHSNSANLGLP